MNASREKLRSFRHLLRGRDLREPPLNTTCRATGLRGGWINSAERHGGTAIIFVRRFRALVDRGHLYLFSFFHSLPIRGGDGEVAEYLSNIAFNISII